MLARLLRLVLLFELFGYAFLGVGLVRLAGWPPIGAFLLMPLLAALTRAWVIALGYLYAHAYRSALGAGGQLHGAALWRQALDEWSAFTAMGFFEAFEHLLVGADGPRRPGVGGGGRQPLLLVHGYGCNRGVWWWLKPRLEAQGRCVATLSLEPLHAEIDTYAEQIARRVAWLRRETGAERVTLVGHSMGGLACLAYLRRYGEDYVARLITLGTPHRGSGSGRLVPGRNARQMEANSPWLAELARFFEEMPLAIPCIAYYSLHDNLVIPPEAAMMRGAENRALPGLGHIAMATSPRVLEALLAATAAD